MIKNTRYPQCPPHTQKHFLIARDESAQSALKIPQERPETSLEMLLNIFMVNGQGS